MWGSFFGGIEGLRSVLIDFNSKPTPLRAMAKKAKGMTDLIIQRYGRPPGSPEPSCRI